MSKKVFLAVLFITAAAFALNRGDTIHIVYDLQGGVNNPNNVSTYTNDDNDLGRIYLRPPTREGYEFLGWYDSYNKVDFVRPCDGTYDAPQGTFTVTAHWGVVAKMPALDESGCALVHDAAELYGAVKFADSLSDKYKRTCIFIEDDIVVNKNLLAADGTPNEGEHYWWKSFEEFAGVIEGNGHTISGLYGDVGLISSVYANNLVIQNLGITDSYFSGPVVGSFVASLTGYGLLMKNVYSTATVVSDGNYSHRAGGLIGKLDGQGDACLDVLDAPPDRSPGAYEISYSYYLDYSFAVEIENAYYAGHIAGVDGGGLVGIADNVSFKNAFFAGTEDVSGKFAVIGKIMPKGCHPISPDDISIENTFYPATFEADEFKATAAAATEFTDGTLLAKLVNGSDVPIWVQGEGDAYPKLNGVFYDITYTLNGGVNDAANPVHFSPKQEISLQPATKEGDVFEGWFLDSNFTIPVEKIAATAEGNQKLFAKWQSGYSITYVNDDTYQYGLRPNPTYRYADSATFKLKEPIGSGRTFDGWYTDSTFTTRVTELPTGNTEDIVLYAKWISHEVKLVYRLNGGTIGAGENPDKVMNGEKILLKDPTREGFVFNGWYDGSKQYGSLKRYRNEPYHVNTNADQVILYARWTYEPKKPEVDADGCYLVTNANELYYLNPYYNTNAQAESLPYRACIKIMNDIVVNPGLPQEHLAVIEWKPLNSLYPFIGIIYGNGHVINGLYMDYELSYPGEFYGLISNDVFDGEYPEVRNLGMKNFFYDNTFYTYTVYINYKGSPGYKIGIQKKMAPAPLKQNRLPKYDAKGRALKVRPNYGVLF